MECDVGAAGAVARQSISSLAAPISYAGRGLASQAYANPWTARLSCPQVAATSSDGTHADRYLAPPGSADAMTGGHRLPGRAARQRE
jgi:hypothetical protein